VVLPLLGAVLNGTSSILYGTVPSLAPGGDIGRGFAVFYISVIGAGGLAPMAYGVIADHSGRTAGILAAALTAAVIVPFVLVLRPFLKDEDDGNSSTNFSTGSADGEHLQQSGLCTARRS
jgi:MFS transporter, FSR family, fosmidomycin resistance protein